MRKLQVGDTIEIKMAKDLKLGDNIVAGGDNIMLFLGMNYMADNAGVIVTLNNDGVPLKLKLTSEFSLVEVWLRSPEQSVPIEHSGKLPEVDWKD